MLFIFPGVEGSNLEGGVAQMDGGVEGIYSVWCVVALMCIVYIAEGERG